MRHASSAINSHWPYAAVSSPPRRVRGQLPSAHRRASAVGQCHIHSSPVLGIDRIASPYCTPVHAIDRQGPCTAPPCELSISALGVCLKYGCHLRAWRFCYISVHFELTAHTMHNDAWRLPPMRDARVHSDICCLFFATASTLTDLLPLLESSPSVATPKPACCQPATSTTPKPLGTTSRDLATVRPTFWVCGWPKIKRGLPEPPCAFPPLFTSDHRTGSCRIEPSAPGVIDDVEPCRPEGCQWQEPIFRSQLCSQP